MTDGFRDLTLRQVVAMGLVIGFLQVGRVLYTTQVLVLEHVVMVLTVYRLGVIVVALDPVVLLMLQTFNGHLEMGLHFNVGAGSKFRAILTEQNASSLLFKAIHYNFKKG
jgi:hypothetical protein